METVRKRVMSMEEILDEQMACQKELREAMEKVAELNDRYVKLRDYYGSEEMDEDLKADEAGKLDDINRGVLTEDLVYNLMGDRYELGLDLLELAHMLLKHY